MCFKNEERFYQIFANLKDNQLFPMFSFRKLKKDPTIFFLDNLEIKMQGKDFIIVFNSNTLSSHATAKDGLKCNETTATSKTISSTHLSDKFVRQVQSELLLL